MKFYPQKVDERLKNLRNAGKLADANAVATSATFTCGAALKFFLRIEKQTKEILEAKFQTNGCGFSIAAADVLAEIIMGKTLIELHGLDHSFLRTKIEAKLEKYDESRIHCFELSLDALQSALAAFRKSQVEEFAGEKALICSCFGVSEETIEKIVSDNEIETVEEVTDLCKAGGGCGSCQLLIQEIIDIYWQEQF